MQTSGQIPLWTIAAPIFAGAVLLASVLGVSGGIMVALIALGLAGSVFAAVHHAESIADRIGEPFGTLVLALAVTLIEVALIVSLMAAGGEEAAGLARDTVFAAVMIILNGIIGLCLLVGGLTHRQQSFSLDGVGAALVALGAIVILTLVFPNYTVTTPGPYYSRSQLTLIAIVTVVVYGTFVFTQTVGHRQFFLHGAAEQRRHGRKLGAAADVPVRGGAAGQEAGPQPRGGSGKNGGAECAGRRDHRRHRTASRGARGAARGAGESPADQPQSCVGIGAG